MRIPDMLCEKKKIFSFEFFPPKTPDETKLLYSTLKDLQPLRPDFISITHSPTGIAPLKTAALSRLIKDRFDFEPMAHLTCISQTRAEIAAIAGELKRHGMLNVLALRGDKLKSPEGAAYEFRDYRHASQLVKDLKRINGFSIGVAGYPEKHPEAASLAADIARLKEKVDNGAEFIITQLFFENKSYFSFVEKCRKAGITAPIIPGIMPLTGVNQLKRFAVMCGAKIPGEMTKRLDKTAGDSQAVINYGIDYALSQCRELLAGGAPGVHFYTLNKSPSTRAILQELRKKYQ